MASSCGCRSADDLLTRCVQIHAAGNTTWVDPSTSWQKVHQSVLTMIDKADGSLAYVKNASLVVIQSDAAWSEACANGVYAARNGGRALDLQYVPAPSSCCSGANKTCGGKPATPSCCPTSSSSSCCPKPSQACDEVAEKLEKVCIHPIANGFTKPKDCRTSGCCPPMPEPGSVPTCVKCPEMYDKTSPAEGVDVGPKPENPLLSQYKYANEALRCCQLPLGPLGGGVIAVSGDGGLRQWQMINEVYHNAHIPDSFWAVKVEAANSSTCAVLQSNKYYDNAGFVPAAIVTDHIVPPASIELLKKLPGVPDIEITAKYPTVEVDYPNSGLPVGIHMTAFNPCIPQNSDDSGIPILIFTFEVDNPSNEDVQVSMLSSMQNMVGWDGHAEIANEVEFAGYGGNSNSLLHLNDNVTVIDMSNSSLVDPGGYDYNPHDGHFASAVVTQDLDVVSTLLQYNSVEAMWAEFTSSGGLSGKGMPGPSPTGRTWNSALANTRIVKAKSTTTFTFFLSWHFPHRFTNWSQPMYASVNPPLYLGNYYATLFKDITAVLKYTHDNLARLTDDTMRFRDCMYDSTLPWQLIDSAAGRVSPLRSPTCMWLSDKRFYAFEGCATGGGCCPLNCTHVWNYEQALCQLWPDLEQSMRDVDLCQGHQVTPLGRLLSRIPVPLYLRPMWMYWKDYDEPLNAQDACVDGEIGAVLKLYREVRNGCSDEFLAKCWPNAKDIMSRWLSHNDMGDGTMKIAQPSTYDVALYGVNTFIGTLYLAGLLAAQKLALLVGDTEAASEYGDRYVLGRASLDKKCFTNGKWYTQQVAEDEPKIQLLTDSTFVDCLLGQWWGYILDLGDILPYDHCQSTVQNIFLHNHIEGFNPATQAPRKFFDSRDSGLVIATWPNGDMPATKLLYTTECAWTGLAHYFAGLCIYLGEVATGLTVLEDSRNSYDGTRRSPWNEIECGDHYSRPMCAFQLFATASGITWDRVSIKDKTNPLSVGFNPRIGADKFAGFFTLPGGWGQYLQQQAVDKASGQAQIKVAYGQLTIVQLKLPFVSTAVKVTLDTAAVPVSSVSKVNNMIVVAFSKAVVVKAMSTLEVVIST